MKLVNEGLIQELLTNLIQNHLDDHEDTNTVVKYIEDLVTLCEQCHRDEHEEGKSNDD